MRKALVTDRALDPGAHGDIACEMAEAGERTAMFDENGAAYDKSKLTS